MTSPDDFENPHFHYSNNHETFGSNQNDRNFDKVPYDSPSNKLHPVCIIPLKKDQRICHIFHLVRLKVNFIF